MAEQEFIQGTIGGIMKVTVRDGKIIRMRPIVFGESDGGQWTIEAKGKEFSDPRKTTLNPYVVGERMRVYAENRIKYPSERKNFDPNGERHPELRGKDEYVRISWDEALDIVAGEIKRIRATYGQAAITAMTSSHHNWGLLYYKMGPRPASRTCWATPSCRTTRIPGKGLALGSHPYLGLVRGSWGIATTSTCCEEPCRTPSRSSSGRLIPNTSGERYCGQET